VTAAGGVPAAPRRRMFHVEHAIPPQLVRLSPDQVTLLERYTDLLADRAIPLGLIAASDRERLFERHVADSLRAVRCIEPGERTVVDVGSGAGLPGIPLAIALPDRAVTLLDRSGRRIAFLELVVDELMLANAMVIRGRAEEAAVRVQVATVRAFADIGSAWRVAQRLIAPDGKVVYFAGRSWQPPVVPGGVADGTTIEIRDEDHRSASGPLVIIRRTGNG